VPGLPLEQNFASGCNRGSGALAPAAAGGDVVPARSVFPLRPFERPAGAAPPSLRPTTAVLRSRRAMCAAARAPHGRRPASAPPALTDCCNRTTACLAARPARATAPSRRSCSRIAPAAAPSLAICAARRVPPPRSLGLAARTWAACWAPCWAKRFLRASAGLRRSCSWTLTSSRTRCAAGGAPDPPGPHCGPFGGPPAAARAVHQLRACHLVPHPALQARRVLRAQWRVAPLRRCPHCAAPLATGLAGGRAHPRSAGAGSGHTVPLSGQWHHAGRERHSRVQWRRREHARQQRFREGGWRQSAAGWERRQRR